MKSMAKNISNENFINIQGWMINELNLKGNELIIYACIYGFSQAENQKFTGSLTYLSEWTNSTKRSVINVLKSLCEKGFIIKNEVYKNEVRVCEYYAKKFTPSEKNSPGGGEKSSLGGSEKSSPPSEKSSPGGGEKSSPNNIDIDNIKDNIYIIVNYLNLKADKSFKRSTPETQKHISARLKEGFTVEDFKIVIDKKVNEWKGTDFEKFLRPQTLFGTKFESYLNQTSQIKNKSTNSFLELAKEMGVEL